MTTTTDFPKLRIGLDGEMSVIEAPDEALFPLSWIMANDRSKNLIQTKGNEVKFLPTDGDAVVYKITGFDFDSRRFVGKRVR